MKIKIPFPLHVALAAAVWCPLFAVSEITVDESFNDVSITNSQNRKSIRTGPESRTQISNDTGTIRVGASSKVSVGDDGKTIDLREGVMMVKTTSKGLFGRNSLTVETDQVKATSNSSMLISYQPKRYIKIACLEGKVTIALKGLSRDSVTIRKGQLLVINCLENVLPAAVSVDMNRLMQTSPLLGPGLRGGPAPNTLTGRLGPPPGQGNGPPPENRQGNQPPPQNGPGSPPPPNTTPLPPVQSSQPILQRGPAQPRPNDLPGRRIDCQSPNDPNCRPAPRPPGS